MTTRTDRLTDAAVRTAKRAKQWAVLATREADRLLREARSRADTPTRRYRLKQALRKSARVLRTAGEAALVAGITAGIAAIHAEHKKRELPKPGDR